MPGSPKRRSLVRLLASLCPPPSPSRAPSFPVHTGFPTSLADLILGNHGRLRKQPRKPHRPAAADALAPVAAPVEVAEELTPPPTTQTLSPVTMRRQDAAPRLPEGAAVFRLRPELLAVCGAVALALLAVWSQGTVAAFTVVALSLLWIESASRRRPPPTLLDSCGRGPVTPIREAEEEPRCSSSDSDKGSESAELVAAAGGGGEPTTPKNKRSLRRMISKKLLNKPKSNDSSRSLDDRPEAAVADPDIKTESLVVAASESSVEECSSSSSEGEAEVVVDGVRFPLSVFLPVILAGLAAGKLPATALAVVCVALYSGAVHAVHIDPLKPWELSRP